MSTWWTRAVFYEIYVRSFQDSNGDGIGDLNGIASRLDYLADLGVTALWITPFYPSPQVDFGYDVSDYEGVDPQFGTLADFDRLLEAAHRRGIRIVIDVVLNHTSDRHAWFESSRASASSPLRDWYVWRDGRPGGGPPSNWESVFGGPAWTLDEPTGQWYYHCFYREQPDLNWRNPDVEARMHQVLQFWIDRGVDGFRLDAVSALFEDPALRDNPLLPEPRITLTGVVSQATLYNRRPDEVHGALRRLRSFVDRRAPHAVLISEAYLDSAIDLAAFYGDGDEMQLPFNFFLAQVPSLDAAAFRAAIDAVEAACAGRWPSLVLNNHDIDRACDRLAPRQGSGQAPRPNSGQAPRPNSGQAPRPSSGQARGGDRDAVARLLAVLLLTLRGTPFLYYGDEIGVTTEPPARLEDVRDPVGRRFWPRYKGRDGVRRPMPWTGGPGHGFTSGAAWLPFGSDADVRNVAAQDGGAASLLTLSRRLLALRRGSAALCAGRYVPVASDPRVLAFRREQEGDRVLVAINMSAANVAAPLDEAGRWSLAIGTHDPGPRPVDARALTLGPYEAVVLVGAA